MADKVENAATGEETEAQPLQQIDGES